MEVADHRREGVRARDRTEEVVGAVHVGDPVAEGLVDGVLEGAGAGLHGDDLGAEHPHARHVQRLPLGVDLAHVDGAFEAEERARGRGRDTVLAGSGLGDDTGLAHALGEQRLAQHVVDLVRTGVVEVLALEEDPRAAGVLGEACHLGQGAGPARVVHHQFVELGGEGGVGLGLVVLGGDLVHGGDERLRDELSAVRAEVAFGAGDQTLRVRNEEVGRHLDVLLGMAMGGVTVLRRERSSAAAVAAGRCGRADPPDRRGRRPGLALLRGPRAPSHAVDLTGLVTDHVPHPPAVHTACGGAGPAGDGARNGRGSRAGPFVRIGPDQGAGSGACGCKAEEGVTAEHWRPTTTPQPRVPDPASPARTERKALSQLRPCLSAGWAPAATRSATAARGSRPVTRDSPTSTPSAPALA